MQTWRELYENSAHKNTKLCYSNIVKQELKFKWIFIYKYQSLKCKKSLLLNFWALKNRTCKFVCFHIIQNKTMCLAALASLLWKSLKTDYTTLSVVAFWLKIYTYKLSEYKNMFRMLELDISNLSPLTTVLTILKTDKWRWRRTLSKTWKIIKYLTMLKMSYPFLSL